MSNLFQITEEDLCELEKMVPELADALLPVLNVRIKIKLRRCQSILSSIRWKYGPPDDVTVIPADGK